ncbi:MAG: cbb3-type cytochrome c oxidase subunit I [Chlamydiia bacterium]|nr:cbb3-type cytochrome c oxidase subunit I [Chlamydiia bacterium]
MTAPLVSPKDSSLDHPYSGPYDLLLIKLLLYPAIGFFVFGTLVGAFLSVNGYVLPDYFSGEYITFGRIRPMHVASVALLWLLSADLGLMFYFVPRLCCTRVYAPRVAMTGIALWWFSTVIGTFSFPFATNSGWEYAELPMWLGFLPIKLISAVGFVLIAFSLLGTILTRTRQQLYVSLWYTIATLLWTALTYVFGNFWVEMVPGGISRINVNYFYVHNLVGLIFTPMGLATAYFFLPKFANRPIYSHTLSLIGFWSIAFFYPWIGAHHIIHGPISQWLQTVSIVFSIWLFIPVWSVIVNLFGTMRGHWNSYSHSAPLRFLLMGVLFYLMVCIQGPLMALRNINEITSKTDWIIGHAHMALYGTFTFFAIAGIYWVIPVLAQREIWSRRLADWHFNLSLLGGLLMFTSLFIGGFMQGLEWSNWATGGSYFQFQLNLAKLPFIETVAQQVHVWKLRSLSGILIATATILFATNLVNTLLIPAKEEA